MVDTFSDTGGIFFYRDFFFVVLWMTWLLSQEPSEFRTTALQYYSGYTCHNTPLDYSSGRTFFFPPEDLFLGEVMGKVR